MKWFSSCSPEAILAGRRGRTKAESRAKLSGAPRSVRLGPIFFFLRERPPAQTAPVTLDEYLYRDAVALAALVRRWELAPTELLDMAVARLDAVNPAINAVTTRLLEFAMREIEQGLPDGPFRGVPFLLKDQVDQNGKRVSH